MHPAVTRGQPEYGRQALKLDRYSFILLYKFILNIPVIVVFKYLADPENRYYFYNPYTSDNKRKPVKYGFAEAPSTGNGNPVVWIPYTDLQMIELKNI